MAARERLWSSLATPLLPTVQHDHDQPQADTDIQTYRHTTPPPPVPSPTKEEKHREAVTKGSHPSGNTETVRQSDLSVKLGEENK